MLQCRKCLELKDESEFYPSNITGRAKHCKACRDAYMREYHKKNYEKRKVQARERMRRWRENNPEKARKATTEAYSKRADKIRDYQKEKYKVNQRQIVARRIAGNAKKRGLLKEQPCHICGATKVEMHHDDYDKPLDVKWMCPKHHKRHHIWID